MSPPHGVVRALGTGAVAGAIRADLPDRFGGRLRVRALPGGHSWHTYEAEDETGNRVVVRVTPAGGTLDPYDPEREAAAMRAAVGVVPVPRVLVVVPSPNAMGAPYAVHEWADGHVLHLGEVLDEDEQGRYRTAMSRALGQVHAGCDPAALGDPPPTVHDALAAELGRTIGHFSRSAPCRHPGITIGLRWLRTRLPHAEDAPVLCHGDFRLHNLAWSGVGELAAVLDWERAWAGDAMADVAFTRRFSGWCAVEGDGVAAYEEASGRVVDEARVAYADRFEHIRSYTSATRGLRALVEGRTDRLALYAIGEAGFAGAWELVELLGEGPLAPCAEDGLDPAWAPPVPDDRRVDLADTAEAAGQHRLAEHLGAHDEHDRAARDRSLGALRAAPGPRALRAALDHRDPDRAWAAAHEVLADAALSCGPSLLPALRALGLRDTTRPTLRRTTTLVGGAS